MSSSPRGFLFPQVDPIVSAQQLSIFLEVSGEPKPGNVTRRKAFPEISYDDFAFASASIRDPLRRSYRRARSAACEGKRLCGLWGRALLESSKESMFGLSNTIFGTLLVEIPLGIGASVARPWDSVVRKAEEVVRASDWTDSLDFVRSIRGCGVGNLSHPGFVRSDEALDLEDPAIEAKIRKRKVSLERLLAPSVGYDLLASELVGGFPIISKYAPKFVAWLREFQDPIKASAATYCSLLAEYPDSLVGRKAGAEVAKQVMVRAARVMRFPLFSARWLKGMERLDADLRKRDLNPGTLADLTAASIFLALIGAVPTSAV